MFGLELGFGATVQELKWLVIIVRRLLSSIYALLLFSVIPHPSDMNDFVREINIHIALIDIV